jgi:hypothetical protein
MRLACLRVEHMLRGDAEGIREELFDVTCQSLVVRAV